MSSSWRILRPRTLWHRAASVLYNRQFEAYLVQAICVLGMRDATFLACCLEHLEGERCGHVLHVLSLFAEPHSARPPSDVDQSGEGDPAAESFSDTQDKNS